MHSRPVGSLLVCGFVVCSFAGIASPAARAQGNDSKIDPAFTAWYYPGAKSPGYSTTFNKLHQTILQTPDEVHKVENHYRKLTHDPLQIIRDAKSDPPPFGIHTSKGYPHPKHDTQQIVVKWGDDSKTETDGDERGVTIRTLVYDTADELISVTISRTPKEKTTHIVLVCLQKK
jgi:hypothetical protein